MSIQSDDTRRYRMQMTRREFMVASTMAGICSLSDRVTPKWALITHDDAPFVAKFISLDGRAGDIELLGRLSRAASTDVAILHSADIRHFNALLDGCVRINSLNGLRKFLLHRPLDFNALSRTLEQVHCDSERCRVDGWQISTEYLNPTREFKRCIPLTLKLVSRTHSPVVSIAATLSTPWNLESLASVYHSSGEFRDVRFVMLGFQDVLQASPLRYSTRFADTIRSVVLSPNVYFVLQEPKLNAGWEIDPSRTMCGSTVQSDGLLWNDSGYCKERGYLGLNAASIYSLNPDHYRAVM